MANGNGSDTGGPGGNALSPWGFGDPEAYGAAEASKAMEPVVSNYFQKVLSGQMAKENLAKLDVQYDPNQSFAQNVLNPQGMEAATNVALSMGPGVIGGVNATPGVVFGSKAGTFLDAQKLEAGGATRREVFEQTGWFRGARDPQTGAGGEWQFIIPDKNAQLNTSNLEQTTRPSGRYLGLGRETIQNIPHNMGPDDVKLGDILDHDDLYEAYPWAKDITVRPTSGVKFSGSYDPELNTMWVAPQREGDMLSTIIHETQHAIQNHEGFPRGGSTDEFLPPDFQNDYDKMQNGRDQLARDIHVAGFNPDLVSKEFGFYPETAPNPAFQGHSDGLDPNMIQNFGYTTRRLGEMSEQQAAAREDYMRLGGEVQSRAVEAMLRNQRWDQLPEEAGEVGFGPGKWGDIQPYTPQSQQLLIYPKQPWRGGGQGLPPPPPGYEGHSELPPAPDGYGYEPMPEGFDPFGGQGGSGQ